MVGIRCIDLLSLLCYQVLEKGYPGIAQLRLALQKSHSPGDSHLRPSDLANALEVMGVSPLTNLDNEKVLHPMSICIIYVVNIIIPARDGVKLR